MTISIEEYQKLKQRMEKARSDADKAKGVLSEQMKKLKDDFDCDSIEEVDELLAELWQQEKETEEKYREELKAFEEIFGEQI